ncbi:MAG: hypothetical protein IMY72_06530 [Bacteroidetes bacterium]|nr:hypothetical protein [Bacteroidota bacterium]
MNKKILLTILLSVQMIFCLASEPDSLKNVSLSSFDLLKINNPWLNTSNPAGLFKIKDVMPSTINLGLYLEDGDYKRVQQGDNIMHYRFLTESYLNLHKFNLFGSFKYDKSYESNLDYSCINNPFRNTPYTMIDTIGGDKCDREFFTVKGGFSVPLSEKLTLGGGVVYNIGLSSQDRDPRPQNKVLDFSVTSGLMYSLDKFNFGLNFIYEYYNEDIDVKIIAENEYSTLFQIHGPGMFNYHRASSFARLYTNDGYGLDAQINYDNGDFNTLFGAKVLFSKEEVHDGRKAANASWSVSKFDSKFEGLDVNVYNHTTINNGLSIHAISANAIIKTYLGTEIIQKLEQVGNTDLEQWVTYAEEEKYGSTHIDAKLIYNFIRLKNKYNKNYGVKLAVNYFSFEEKYYLPEQAQSYENLLASIYFDKSFYLGKSVFSVSAGCKYKTNLSGKQDFEQTNFIVDKLLIPDFKYLTDSYYAPGLMISYEKNLTKYFDEFFINTNVDLIRASNDASRVIVNFTFGVNF